MTVNLYSRNITEVWEERFKWVGRRTENYKR